MLNKNFHDPKMKHIVLKRRFLKNLSEIRGCRYQLRDMKC